MLDKEIMDFLDGASSSSFYSDNKSQFEFTKVREVHSPDKAYSSAGIDFYIPVFNGEFRSDLEERSVASISKIEWGTDDKGNYFVVPPQCRVAIPSGIKVHLNVPGTVLIAFNKSGVATKFGLDVGACVVDEDYLGEVHISLKNDSNVPVKLYENQKATQFVYLPLVKPCFIKEISNEEYDKYHTERGEGRFGSSDNKK